MTFVIDGKDPISHDVYHVTQGLRDFCGNPIPSAAILIEAERSEINR